MTLSAYELGFRVLNDKMRAAKGKVVINNCFGERFIGAGADSQTIIVNGTPGNALGMYLDGATIIVNGNAQDAVGDTMNDGKIIIHGNAGDALGYAMRGGKIFVKGDSGYRTGIHMKEYMDKKPVIIIGGCTGSFLGEYLAGGVIIVLGLNTDGWPAGDFTGVGMHGGEMFIRSSKVPLNLPPQVSFDIADEEDLEKIRDDLLEFGGTFGVSTDEIFSKPFYHLVPNGKNPFKKLYTEN
ncbi:glutamate synthase (NADPH) GltB3 subunit [Thermoclostridium stercorarium subsp. stercorarium DSM 8532]|jgi:glutamate synthase domain-containing protein 3|uniref:Glutamate synthase (NADPH) GltB3 subunit n=3 Tax=Thermoclostridium stercorarium TaxID=1510 RepID=L7VQU4_THES1|nr:glutamate synthase [Thermoclostridium stercorarium]AGC68761.1 glutamate synthase (NADPH) GltB3 subunit [Thermoclostridium stercorarium subsp. stercorarium DSM 8532]AGI39767.1 glutamate synthase-3 [Thermoclostridium stercorarium subsp. stercorarium DSM 8532]ANW99083.1 glutamate synthase [Thermoclostridium stercorarium subsp. thermolacticum DSM 2910]ANX01619.1 glutamate synthase [Thermoclostridium stercorarium subsp. leptospartum DSM 9219]UZQ84730.1 glutamate synthase [Thermoclostridium sterc